MLQATVHPLVGTRLLWRWSRADEPLLLALDSDWVQGRPDALPTGVLELLRRLSAHFDVPIEVQGKYGRRG
ncbi:hypothetical protein CLV68_5984 [Actinokineospora cianjurensis]|uniref:Uncharacterized protein n=1 Tax=Actinokineospora cianjurensis TaxID=585224 RepID=A0A421AXA1_9PSEU|nr:hypothetical protein CLV68_5984 [Actinokineospora cianjurensis]